MKTIYTAIILGIIVAASIIFAMVIQPESPLIRKGILPFPQEDYHIKITGLKDVYLVGEPYSFGYTISGYGYPCGDIQVVYPDISGNSVFENSYKDCDINQSMHKFTYTATDKTETDTLFDHDGIMNPGVFIVSIGYEHGGGIEPAQGGKQFHVVENICNDGSDKQNAECFVESYDTCESAYMTQQFLTEKENEMISLKATVDSWHDCKLTVYTENSLGEHTPFNGIRSICKDMTVNEDSLSFENCNNADYLPIMFGTKQDSNSQTELVDKNSSSSVCPDGINDEFDTQRRITSCGANPPQSKSSILELDGIQTCLHGSDNIFYMNSGESGTITYSYEVTENKRNPNEKFDLHKPPHFMCSIQRGIWESCTPEGINVSYDTDKKYMSIKEPTIITANIQIDDDAPTQSFQWHLSPNICAYPNLLFNVLGNE